MEADDSEILGSIDRKIARLQEIRQALIDENLVSDSVAVKRHVPARQPSSTARKSHRNKKPVIKETKSDVLVAWLKSNGPATRGAIVKGSGIKEGTVSFLLSKSDLFRRLEDGRWAAV
ncbi:MAG: hypothetical protein M3Y72_02745 [Acidobacteriota bacterium]|nr:hypothetical protein [Acidobacteriota bacterium]